jgi:PAS domain S-box-containing protein
MIAVVDMAGNRLYNGPAYQRVLGYTTEELQSTSSFEQIHPDDRLKIRPPR